MSKVTEAFKDAKAAAESLRNAEFHLGLLPEKPTEVDGVAVRTHLEDVRIALGRLSLKLADMHGELP
jgi:hypothetical protein